MSLGLSRRRIRKLFPGFSTRGRSSMDFICGVRNGIRVGYPSSRLLAGLGSRMRTHVRGQAILILTASRAYAVDGMRPGERLRGMPARRRAILGPPYWVGANTWYLPARRGARGILKVRAGVVEEVGLVDPRLARGRRRARLLLASFG